MLKDKLVGPQALDAAKFVITRVDAQRMLYLPKLVLRVPCLDTLDDVNAARADVIARVASGELQLAHGKAYTELLDQQYAGLQQGEMADLTARLKSLETERSASAREVTGQVAWGRLKEREEARQAAAAKPRRRRTGA